MLFSRIYTSKCLSHVILLRLMKLLDKKKKKDALFIEHSIGLEAEDDILF